MKSIYILLSFVGSLFLPSKKVVYFCSFFGQYSDNPKYIYRKLIEKYPDINVVWCTNNKDLFFPKEVKTVTFRSFYHYFYVFNAAVVVDNNLGLRQYSGNNGIIAKFFLGILSRRTSKQLNISTWHGTPYKRIGMDSIDFPKNNRFYHNSDYTIAGCQLTYDKFKTAFGNDLPILKYGTPRNDVFFRACEVGEIKGRLKLPGNKKILLFAPTFRKEISQNGACQLEAICPEKLLSTLAEKFGGEWAIVCRFHSHVLSNVDLTNLYSDSILNGNIGNDMQEYLMCADALITDFSSSFFDYALTKRPCFLFAPDMNFYASCERGVYLTDAILPYSIAYTAEELYDSIINFDDMAFGRKVTSFLNYLGNFEDGMASTRIVNDIVDFYKTKKKKKYEG